MAHPERIMSHRDLTVWQKGIDLAEQVYALTSEFPREEMYGLSSQLRRASASVAANIAEGNARDSTKDYLRFIAMSVGSLAEVETFLELARRLGYCPQAPFDSLNSLVEEERRMLRALQNSLRAKLAQSP